MSCWSCWAPAAAGRRRCCAAWPGWSGPDSGRIRIGSTAVLDGRTEVPTHRRGIGMVFQNYALWPHMTVAQNVAYPLRVTGVDRRSRAAAAAEALALVECTELAERLPAAISGGQQQRVALARAVVGRPQVILFDEPLSNLDYRLRGQLRREIRHLHRTLGFTGVYVTHDQTEAMQLGTRVAVLREGRIEQLAAPEDLFTRPATTYVARFLGIDNRLPLRRGAAGVLPAGAFPGDGVEVRLRASDLLLAPPGGTGPGRVALPGVVRDVLFGGDVCDWLVEVADGTLLTATAQARTWPFAAGDAVDVGFDVGAALVYDADGQLVDDVVRAAAGSR